MISSAHMRVRALRGVIAESAWEFLGYEGHELEKTPEFQVLVKGQECRISRIDTQKPERQRAHHQGCQGIDRIQKRPKEVA